MDFEDTPEEAAFRAEARVWLNANAEPLDPDEPPFVDEAVAWKEDLSDESTGIVREGCESWNRKAVPR